MLKVELIFCHFNFFLYICNILLEKNMGKNFCKIDKKWCKFLSHNKCIKANSSLDCISRCPRLAEIETKRLSDLLKEVTFEDVFEALCHYYRNQENNENAYRKVFFQICRIVPQKHKFDDLFIEVTKMNDNDGIGDYLYVHGVPITTKENKTYALEFTPWNEWVSMFITQATLDSLTKEEIVASCLFEMTFYGFDEIDISIVKKNILDK